MVLYFRIDNPVISYFRFLYYWGMQTKDAISNKGEIYHEHQFRYVENRHLDPGQNG
jgi:hypothetical protein